MLCGFSFCAPGGIVMRQLALVVLDLFLIALSTVGALLLRDNFEITDSKIVALAPYLLLTLLIAAAVFPAIGTSRSVWRLTTMADYLTILGGTVATVLGAVALGFGVN